MHSSEASHYEAVNLKEVHEQELPMQTCMAYGLVGHSSQSAVAATGEPTYESMITNNGPLQ